MLELLAYLSELVFFAAFVSTGGSFPEPLSREEERVALIALRQGDADARERLIKHNLRLVAHIAKKYMNANLDQEDLISIGTIGLIKGISTFDPDKGANLATYAARCIQNAMLSQRHRECVWNPFWKFAKSRLFYKIAI